MLCERRKEFIIVLLIKQFKTVILRRSEAATGNVLENKMFLKISQISQENNCVGVSF